MKRRALSIETGVESQFVVIPDYHSFFSWVEMRLDFDVHVIASPLASF